MVDAVLQNGGSLTDCGCICLSKKKKNIVRGSLKMLLFNKTSIFKLISFILILVPFWFMAFFVNFAPEIAKSIGIKETISQGFSLGIFGLYTPFKIA